MVTFKNYDNVNLIEECFYDSSNILYSKLLDKKDELKTLYIVFSNGQQYRYDNVSVTDYLSFRNEESTGKALNKYISRKGIDGKPKYAYEKVEAMSREQVDTRRSELQILTEGSEQSVQTDNQEEADE